MRHLSLFAGSGIGTLAARSAGIATVAHAENDPACCYCLERLWPEARLFRDVRDVTAESVADLGRIDIVSGGFPCQDVSIAGKGEGLGTEENPTRSGLWYEFARVIRETRPRWVLIENVPALRVRGGDRVTNDLEAMAYEWEAVVVGAWSVGAPHKRDRVWIVGRLSDAGRDARPSPERGPEGRTAAGRTGETVADATQQREREQDNEEFPEPQSGEARQDAGWRSGGELADSDSPRLPLAVCEQGDTRQEQQAAVRGRWPARPGEPQHAWEAPRLIEFGMGDAVDGLSRRVRSRANKALLRMVGNAWCYPVAETMFRAIVEINSSLLNR